MNRSLPTLALALAFFAPASGSHGADDWPWWRGPNHNGIANPDQTPPTEFGATSNVRWVADVPGRGHGSPSVFGDRVFLATADETTQSQALLCFDRATGRER